MVALGDTRLPSRFWTKVQRDDITGCWLWTAAKLRGGYACYHNPGGTRAAHRVAYEALVGPVARELDVDHLCRVRHCVNPAHLEPVTHAENMRRGEQATATHCQRGHELTSDNIYWQGGGRWRTCRLCKNGSTRTRR